MFFYLFSLIATSMVPMFISYAKDLLNFPSSRVTLFTAAYFLGPILGGIFFTPLADRYGFRLVAVISNILLMVAFLIPLILWQKTIPIIFAYILYSCASSIMATSSTNLASEIIKNLPPAMIFAVTNTIAMPVIIIISPLAGLLIDVFGNQAYIAVFTIGIVCSFTAMLGFRLLLREPRTGQELHIQINNLIYR